MEGIWSIKLDSDVVFFFFWSELREWSYLATNLWCRITPPWLRLHKRLQIHHLHCKIYPHGHFQLSLLNFNYIESGAQSLNYEPHTANPKHVHISWKQWRTWTMARSMQTKTGQEYIRIFLNLHKNLGGKKRVNTRAHHKYAYTLWFVWRVHIIIHIAWCARNCCIVCNILVCVYWKNCVQLHWHFLTRKICVFACFFHPEKTRTHKEFFGLRLLWGKFDGGHLS